MQASQCLDWSSIAAICESLSECQIAAVGVVVGEGGQAVTIHIWRHPHLHCYCPPVLWHSVELSRVSCGTAPRPCGGHSAAIRSKLFASMRWRTLWTLLALALCIP